MTLTLLAGQCCLSDRQQQQQRSWVTITATGTGNGGDNFGSPIITDLFAWHHVSCHSPAFLTLN